MNDSHMVREGFNPNRVMHEPVRLQIIGYLAASCKQVSFTELKEKLGLSAGNLSVQLKRLEETEYITINKSIRDRKSLTCVVLTYQGMTALQQYLEELEEMIEQLKKRTMPAKGRGTPHSPVKNKNMKIINVAPKEERE